MTKKSDAPAIRFKGFSDAWEQRKAIDIADYSKGNGYSKGDLTDAGTPIILYGRLYTKYQFAISEVDTFAVPRNGAVYSQGNEVIVPASGETAEDIARASAVEESGVLLGGDLNILRPFDFINPLFLALAISNGEPQKKLAKKAQGKSVVHIHNTDIQEVTIAYPSRTEQDRIVSVFRQLDNLITLHQRKCALLFSSFQALISMMFTTSTFSWEQRKLSEMCGTFEYGLNAAAKEFDGKNKYIRITDIDDASREFLLSDLSSPDICLDGMSKYLLSSGDIVFARTGASVGKTYIYRENDGIVYFAGFLIRAKVNQDNDAEFVFQSTLSPSYEKYIRITSQRSGQPGVNAQEYGEYDLFAPSKEEQQRIGQFLRGIDNLITLHQRKCISFTGRAGRLISTVNKKRITSSWEQRKFGEITSKYEDPVPTPHDGYYRLGIRSHAKGTFHSYVAKGQELETAQMHRVAAGNFIVNITFGWEHAVAITDKNDAGKLVSHRFPQFSFAEGMVPEFFRYVIVDEKFRHHLWLASPGGAGRNRVLKLDEMLNYLMRFPSRDEQIKIAEFFRHLDNLITLHQRKFEKLTNVKKSMLEKMFPQNGSSYPEIRFKGFTDPWEQRKFEEIAVRSSVICSDDTLPRVEYEDIVSGTGRLNKDIYAKQSSKSGIVFHQGDVLYGKLRPYLQNWLLPTFDGLAVGDFWVLQPQNADSSFLYRLIQSRQFDEVANQSTGTKMPRADWKLMSKTVFSIPSNISEQAAIGTYFTALDNLITLHQRELEKLQNIKKSMLEKMFV